MLAVKVAKETVVCLGLTATTNNAQFSSDVDFEKYVGMDVVEVWIGVE